MRHSSLGVYGLRMMGAKQVPQSVGIWPVARERMPLTPARQKATLTQQHGQQAGLGKGPRTQIIGF